MATHRIHKTRDYSVMSNAHLNDNRMSLKAKGLLSLMLSLPDEWDYSTAGLVAIVKDGETAVRTALVELETLGYLTRSKVREDGKIVDWQYDVYETPRDTAGNKAEKQDVDFQDAENPQVENPQVENLAQLNTNELNTNKYKERYINNPPTPQEGDIGAPAVKGKTTGTSDSPKPDTNESRIRALSPPLQQALGQWLRYKKEKRQPYTETGLSALITRCEKAVKQFGDARVCELIENSMSCGYQGIVWDKLQQSNATNSNYDELD